MKKNLLVVHLLFIVFYTNGQSSNHLIDSLEFHSQLIAVGGGKGFAPHWITSGRYGVIPDDRQGGLWGIGGMAKKKIGKRWVVNGGFDGYVGNEVNKSLVDQAYVNILYGKLGLKAGWQHFTLGQYQDELTSGSFIVSNNARTIPRIGIGFYDYVDVPFTKGYLQVKGGMNHGWHEKDAFEYSAFSRALLHEKFAYIRTRQIPLNIHAGIVHSVMYGGQDNNGNKIGTDFISTFFAKGSSAAGVKGEATNAIGEHIYLFEIGASFKFLGGEVLWYYQKPGTDATGYDRNFSRNKDFFTGLTFETNKKGIVSNFLFEFDHTLHQGGLGIPDPVDPVKGDFIVVNDPATQKMLTDYYTKKGYDVEGFTNRQWVSFLEAVQNHGYSYGGRVDFYNNSLYRHVRKDRIIGNSLMLTRPELERMVGHQESGSYVINNRIWAYNLGIKGWIKEHWGYRVNLTYTDNYGDWYEYEGRYNWGGVANDPNFNWYWKGSKVQYYTLVESFFKIKPGSKFQATVSVAYDFGDIYHNFGGMVGLKYSIAKF